MFIESSTQAPFDARDLFTVDVVGVERWKLAEFKGLDPESLERLVRQRVTRVKPLRLGAIRVLDVDVGTMSSPDASHELARLQKLLKEPDLGLDVLRFWQNDPLE